MAGTVIRVVPKRTLDFSTVSSGSTLAEEIVLAQGIDISQWREVSLMVRTHSNSITSASPAVGKIEINAYLEGRTPEDPGILFAAVSAAGVVTINAVDGAPFYQVATCGANTGAMLKIAAKGTRSSSFGVNQIKADISVDLSLKSA